MKRVLRRIFIHLLVFVISLGGTAFLLNSETTDDRSDMNNPTLPEVMVDFNGVLANRMYGYKQQMQADFTRDSITPLDATKDLEFVINPYEAKVNSLAYEIRTSDGSKVIENKKVKNLTSSNNYLRASVEIGSNLLMNQEYSMQITLDTAAGPVYYYTRIISRSQLHVSDYVQFVKSFYEKCMDKNTADDLGVYLEPEDTGTPTNYANISIKSTLAEVSWGSMKPQITKKGIPIIKDINETTASVSIEYEITAKDENGYSEVYDVEEFYRMRYTETRIRLLDFERSANQVFAANEVRVTEDGLVLGIQEKDIVYMANEDTSVVAFVQQGDLWTYVPDSAKFVKVFSFRRGNESDFRDSRQQHDIKIIRVTENGDVDFVLYGYMNRGKHEGYCGVCVYHYNSDQNVVEEKVFIPSTESFEFLDEDLGTLSYVNANNQLFLLLAEKLYRVDINEGKYQILEENIENEHFVISDTNAYAAWELDTGDRTGQIKKICFDTQEVKYLNPDKEQRIITVGFMNEDLIYGIFKESDVLKDQTNHEVKGIHTLRIENFDGELKKEYHKEKYYITDITVGSTVMEFALCKKKDGVFVKKSKDNIMNNKKAITNKISIELVSRSRTGINVRMAFEDAPEEDEPLVLYAKMRNVEEREIVLDTQIPQKEIYYVYAYGKLDSTYLNPADAVQQADLKMGVVLNRSQQYVWERGNKKNKAELNIEDIPEVMLTGTFDEEALQNGLGDNGTIINLSGCTLDSVLYEVSAQRPVIAKTGENSCVVIVGYDEYNTYLYYPDRRTVEPYGLNDSTALFEAAGNNFISYIERVKY